MNQEFPITSISFHLVFLKPTQIVPSPEPQNRNLLTHHSLQNPFDENDNVEEILLNDNHNYELLDEYGLRVSGSRPEKKKNLIKRLLGAPLRKKDAAMEDDQGWTWGKMLFMIMVVVVVLGASASIIIVALIYSGLMKLKQ